MGAANSPCDRIEVSLPDMQTGADLLNPGSASLARLATARSALSAVAGAITQVAMVAQANVQLQTALKLLMGQSESPLLPVRADFRAFEDFAYSDQKMVEITAFCQPVEGAGRSGAAAAHPRR